MTRRLFRAPSVRAGTVAALAAVALIACGGGEPQDEPGPQAWTLQLAPTVSTFEGVMDVCPAQWYAPRNLTLDASVNYAPQGSLVVYVNYVARQLPVKVWKGDGVYVCARMLAPLALTSGTATLVEVRAPEARAGGQP